MNHDENFAAFVSAIVGVLIVIGMLASNLVPSSKSVHTQSEAKPNVVMIIVDTLRQDKLGAYGFSGGTSPEIDRLSKLGVRLDRVIAQSSWTRPSIASMLTSQYPRTLGIYGEKVDALATEFTTLPEILSAAGYTTLGATANANINSAFNFHQGFDRYLDSSVRLRWMGDSEEAWSYDEKKLQSARQIFESLLAEVKASEGPPYYVQANVMEVHEHWDDRMDLSHYEAPFRGKSNSRYLAAVRLVSEEIGRFVRSLRRLPDFERTLFIIVSDHGEGLEDHRPLPDSERHGLLLYESQVLVPLILHATDETLPRGKVVETPSRLLDLVPTVLDYLDLEAPPGLAGVSLMPAIEGNTRPDLPARFVVETEFRSSNAIGVYEEDWRYYEHRRPHLGTDPAELQQAGQRERGRLTNQLESRPQKARAIRAFLRDWEIAHPKAQSTPLAEPLHAVEEAQLRALGYFD